MKPKFAIWTLNLEDKALVVLKSALRLRSEEWVWADAPESADVCVADLSRTAEAQQLAKLRRERLIALVEASAQPPPGQFPHLLLKPLKAPQLVRLLDALVAALPAQRTTPPQAAAPPAQPPPAAPGAEHPWRGRRLRLRQPPNLARYPVSLELMSCIELACRGAVSYEALLQSLPEDREMLHAVLNDAARHGNLTDETGAALAPLEERRQGGLSRFFRKG